MPLSDSLQDHVRQQLAQYFEDLNGTEPAHMHAMMVRAVELPLLQVVMDAARHNQSKAAQWLGLNRNTLRKKLLEHGLIEG